MKKGAEKSPFIIKQSVGKKTYYRNEKGHFVKRDILEFVEPSEVIQGKGDNIKILKTTRKQKTYRTKRKKGGVKYILRPTFGQSIRNTINEAAEKNKDIIISRKGQNVLITKENLVTAQSFNYDVMQAYFDTYVTDFDLLSSPQLRIDVKVNDSTVIMEYEGFNYGEGTSGEDDDYYKARLQFNKKVDTIFSKYFD